MVFGVILVISILGNCGVLWIILGNTLVNRVECNFLKIILCISTSRNVDGHKLLSIVTHSLRPPHLHLQLYTIIHIHARQVAHRHSLWENLLSTNCIYRVWIYGSTYCKINNFVSYLSVSASVFTLLAISNDRRKVTKSLSLFIMLYYSQNLLSKSREVNLKTHHRLMKQQLSFSVHKSIQYQKVHFLHPVK